MPVWWCIYSLEMFMLKLFVGSFYIFLTALNNVSDDDLKKPCDNKPMCKRHIALGILNCYVVEKHQLKAEEQVSSVKNIAWCPMAFYKIFPVVLSCERTRIPAAHEAKECSQS